MAGSALESAILAFITLAIDFVRVVAAIVLVIALPARRNTFSIGATEFGLGAFAIFALAGAFKLVTAITAIVGKITHPLSKKCRN